MAFADHAMLLVTDSFHKAVHAWDVEEGKGHVGFVMGGLREERLCPEDDNEPCPMSVASAGAFVAVSLLLHTVTRSEPNVLIFDASGWVCLRSLCFGEPPDLHALRFSHEERFVRHDSWMFWFGSEGICPPAMVDEGHGTVFGTEGHVKTGHIFPGLPSVGPGISAFTFWRGCHAGCTSTYR